MKVRCVKGSHKLGVVKGQFYPAGTKIFDGEMRLTILVRSGSSEKNILLYVVNVHKNKVDRNEEFNAHNGDPTKKARFVVVTRESTLAKMKKLEAVDVPTTAQVEEYRALLKELENSKT
jgi:hypothetical protein